MEYNQNQPTQGSQQPSNFQQPAAQPVTQPEMQNNVQESQAPSPSTQEEEHEEQEDTNVNETFLDLIEECHDSGDTIIVHLTSGGKLKGWIYQVNEDHFVLVDDNHDALQYEYHIMIDSVEFIMQTQQKEITQ